MKKNLCFGLLVLSLFTAAPRAFSSVEPGAAQQEYEKSVDGIVVRNKRYYKAGSLELTGLVGTMPYNSLVNYLMVGGRLTWHLADHYAWEIIDLQKAFPSVTSFVSNTVIQNGVSNLQTTELGMTVATNFLLSPFYGKIRFFGSSVVYYDIYLALGGGVANTSILTASTTAAGPSGTYAQTTGAATWDPMFDVGLGFKFFINRAMGLVVDLRDYVVYANPYGNAGLGSNYSVFVGLSFFLPPL